MRHTYYVIFLVVFSIFFVGCGDTGASDISDATRAAALSTRLAYTDLDHVVPYVDESGNLIFDLRDYDFFETGMYRSLPLYTQDELKRIEIENNIHIDNYAVYFFPQMEILWTDIDRKDGQIYFEIQSIDYTIIIYVAF